jgi:ABC-type sugar transport system substrate-binding protein
VLKKNKLNGKVPVTGQDATVQGLQNILAGDQCMTVYKAIKQEADAAAELAIALAKGEKPDHGHRLTRPGVDADVPVGAADPEGDLQGRASRTSSRRLRHQGAHLHRRPSPRPAAEAGIS